MFASNLSGQWQDPLKVILLIEDRQSYIDLVIEALANFDENRDCYNLYAVKNGEEALKFLYKKEEYAKVPSPGLILLDLNLPKMNGLEFLSLVKQDSELKTIPVVILTTSNNPQDIFECYKRHANCYITKPPDLDQFFLTIEMIINFWFANVKLPHITKI